MQCPASLWLSTVRSRRKPCRRSVERLKAHDVEIRGDERARAVSEEIIPASEEDWGTEYLDAIISVKIVDLHR